MFSPTCCLGQLGLLVYSHAALPPLCPHYTPFIAASLLTAAQDSFLSSADVPVGFGRGSERGFDAGAQAFSALSLNPVAAIAGVVSKC